VQPNVKRRHIPVWVTRRAMRGVKGLAARRCCRGRSSLEAERVQEPEGDRMTAASINGSPLTLLCGGFLVRRTRFPWGEAGVLGEGMDKRSRGARRGMGPSACIGVAEIMSGRTMSRPGLAVVSCDEETGKPSMRGVYASQRLSLRAGGQARDLTNACRAETRTGLGKSDRPGSQRGFRKRGQSELDSPRGARANLLSRQPHARN
jgi:hypothetical protein